MLITSSLSCDSTLFALTMALVIAVILSFLFAVSASPAHQPLGSCSTRLWSHTTVNLVKESTGLKEASMCSVIAHFTLKTQNTEVLASCRLWHRVKTSRSAEGSTQAVVTSLSSVATIWEQVVSDYSGWGKEEAETTCCSF